MSAELTPETLLAISLTRKSARYPEDSRVQLDVVTEWIRAHLVIPEILPAPGSTVRNEALAGSKPGTIFTSKAQPVNAQATALYYGGPLGGLVRLEFTTETPVPAGLKYTVQNRTWTTGLSIPAGHLLIADYEISVLSRTVRNIVPTGTRPGTSFTSPTLPANPLEVAGYWGGTRLATVEGTPTPGALEFSCSAAGAVLTGPTIQSGDHFVLDMEELAA